MELKIKFKLFDRLLSTTVKGNSVDDIMHNFHLFVMKNLKIDDIEVCNPSYQEIKDVLKRDSSIDFVTHEIDISKPETLEKILFILPIPHLERLKQQAESTENYKTAAIIKAEIVKRFDVSL
jgi:hypothetical protein